MTTYASTNPFLTGAYLSYAAGDTYSDKYNTIGASKEPKLFTLSEETQKYATLSSKGCYDTSDTVFAQSDPKYGALGGKSSSYLSTGYASDSKYSPGKSPGSYDTTPSANHSAGSLLGVEDTPTPTSSIETEDSATREVGEKDVEGDGEQSD